MVTNFFNTSKPIHFVIIGVFTFIVFVLSGIGNIESEINFTLVLSELGKYTVVILSIFVLDFLVNKNKLSKKNGYEILIYSLLLAVLPITMQITNVLLANFFILLALRRIISLRSHLAVKKKLFDAAFWIAIASLFYFWSILFFALIITAIIIYSIGHFKNWIVPFLGIMTVVIIALGIGIVFHDDIGLLSIFLEVMSLNFDDYNANQIVFAITVVAVLSVWALFFFMVNLKQKPKAYRPSYILIIIAFFIGIAIILVSPKKNGSEFLFVFPAITIVISNYLEVIQKRWLAELYIWLLILTPIFLLML
jgi:hypothetical protein